MKKYKCIDELVLDEYDENEHSIENSYVVIEKGSIWEHAEVNENAESIRMYSYSENSYRWIEIPRDMLVEYFEEM